MKPLYLSRHARRRMRLYGISSQEVESTIVSPDLVEPTRRSRLNAIKSVSDRIVRVTYVEEADRIVVITVTPRRRLSGDGDLG